jgi:hypothetical protein
MRPWRASGAGPLGLRCRPSSTPSHPRRATPLSGPGRTRPRKHFLRARRPLYWTDRWPRTAYPAHNRLRQGRLLAHLGRQPVAVHARPGREGAPHGYRAVCARGGRRPACSAAARPGRGAPPRPRARRWPPPRRVGTGRSGWRSVSCGGRPRRPSASTGPERLSKGRLTRASGSPGFGAPSRCCRRR